MRVVTGSPTTVPPALTVRCEAPMFPPRQLLEGRCLSYARHECRQSCAPSLPPSAVVLATAEIADALAVAITRWVANPAADPDNAPPVED